MNVRRNSVFRFVFLLAFGIITTASCNRGVPAQPANSPNPEIAPTTYTIVLFCPECAEEGANINLWKTPDREGVAGSVPHTTSAIVFDSALSKQGVLHYKVMANGITGWVSELFIQR